MPGGPRRLWLGLGCAAVLLVALAGVGRWALWNWQHDGVVCIMLAAGAIYAAAVWLLERDEALLDGASRRRVVLLILGVALLARALIVTAPPVSTDIYRYVWDGRVQAAGINPYRYRPADPQVAFLRDAQIYPLINRAATAVTIYPPAAQLLFRAVTAIAPTVTAMKLAMVACEAILVATVLAMLRRRGLPQSRIVLYAWHPLPLFEFAGSGHIDAAALCLMMLACLAAQRQRPVQTGALLGAAALVKFFPVAILPALYRRWDWRLPLAAAVVAAALYLPFIAVGWQVLGFLPGYLRQEGLASGDGFFLVELLHAGFPAPAWAGVAYVAAGMAVLGAAALRVVFRPQPAPSMSSALWLLAGVTLFISPHLAWYFTWVIPFLCFRIWWSLIYLTVVAPLLYQNLWTMDAVYWHAAIYLPFAAILCIELTQGPRRPGTEPSNDRSFAPRNAD
jgi:hypothetical protein